MEGSREIGMVIDKRIRRCYLCFTYTPVSTVSFVLVRANFKSVSEAPRCRVNSLSIVYDCAIHNLPTPTTTKGTINTKARIFVSHFLFRSMGSDNRTLYFDCVISLSHCDSDG